MDNYFNTLLLISQGNAIESNFAHRKDTYHNTATNISCLGKEQHIPSTALLETNILQQLILRKETFVNYFT
jgi:hypothetical protein